MQKLPEVPDRKVGDAYAKNEPSRQKKRSLSSFSSDQRNDNA